MGLTNQCFNSQVFFLDVLEEVFVSVFSILGFMYCFNGCDSWIMFYVHLI